MNAANQRRLTPLLVLLAVLLGAALLALLSGVGRGVRWGEARPAGALPPPVNPANLPQPQPLQQFALVWEKPLFNPDRKPLARAAEGGSSIGDLELTGIILTPGLRMALLHDRNSDREWRLHEGEALPDGRVRLVQVQPRSALFDAASGRTELKLPAGAPIDARRVAAGTARQASGESSPQSAAEAEPAAQPATPTPASSPVGKPVVIDPATRAAAERLQKAIQKRRAARNAEANEGVR